MKEKEEEEEKEAIGEQEKCGKVVEEIEVIKLPLD